MNLAEVGGPVISKVIQVIRKDDVGEAKAASYKLRRLLTVLNVVHYYTHAIYLGYMSNELLSD